MVACKLEVVGIEVVAAGVVVLKRYKQPLPGTPRPSSPIPKLRIMKARKGTKGKNTVKQKKKKTRKARMRWPMDKLTSIGSLFPFTGVRLIAVIDGHNLMIVQIAHFYSKVFYYSQSTTVYYRNSTRESA